MRDLTFAYVSRALDRRIVHNHQPDVRIREVCETANESNTVRARNATSMLLDSRSLRESVFHDPCMVGRTASVERVHVGRVLRERR